MRWANRENDVNWNDAGAGHLLQLALEAFPNSRLLVDSRGTIALVNHVAEQQFACHGAQLVGRPVERVLPAAADAFERARADANALSLNGEGDGHRPHRPRAAAPRLLAGHRWARRHRAA
jgi:PAS domain-containing protein